jgi:hypothetical protein
MADQKGEPPIVVHIDIRKLKPEPEINRPPVSRAKLEDMIEDAIVDAYTEQEQTVGFLTMLQEHLAMPFSTTVLGVDVVVEKIDITREGQVVAVCRRDNSAENWNPRSAIAYPSTVGRRMAHGILPLAQRTVSERISVL